VTGKYIFTSVLGVSHPVEDNAGTSEKCLRPKYEYCEELHTVGVPGKGWKPCLVSEPQDMKSCWLCLSRGGPAKSPGCKHFYHSCHSMTSVGIVHPNHIPCSDCVSSQSTKVCVHHPVMDVKIVQAAKEELKSLEIAYDKPDEPGNYKVPNDPKTEKKSVVTFDDSRANTLAQHLPKILPKIMADVPNKSDWLLCQVQITAIILMHCSST
jgi:hypothetical protein